MRTNTLSTIGQAVKRWTTQVLLLTVATFTLFFLTDLTLPQSASAYPFWAQATAPETPL